MVAGLVGPLISMICFTCSLVGCYIVGIERGETRQAGQAGDREEIMTGE